MSPRQAAASLCGNPQEIQVWEDAPANVEASLGIQSRRVDSGYPITSPRALHRPDSETMVINSRLLGGGFSPGPRFPTGFKPEARLTSGGQM